MTADVAPHPELPWAAEDPAATYARWHAEREPVFWDDAAEAWVVHRHHEAHQVLRGRGWSSDPTTATPTAGSSDGPAAPPGPGGLLVFLDPPDHTRIRRALYPAFGPAAIATFEAQVRATADTALDALAGDQEVDLMAVLARPLPLAVMAGWLGLDVDRAALLQAEAPALVRLLDPDPGQDDLVRAAGAYTALLGELVPLAEARRSHPGPDLLSWIATAPDLALDEVVSSTLLLAIAGHETTALLLGTAVARGRPALLAAGPDGSSADGLTEVLRLDGPVQVVGRVATEAQVVAGTRIPTGSRVLVVVGAANRDPAAYADPERFDPGRHAPTTSDPEPLAFGLGRHHCLGAHLARLELAVVLDALAARHVTVAGPVTWQGSRAVHGPQRLPVRFRHP